MYESKNGDFTLPLVLLIPWYLKGKWSFYVGCKRFVKFRGRRKDILVRLGGVYRPPLHPLLSFHLLFLAKIYESEIFTFSQNLRIWKIMILRSPWSYWYHDIWMGNGPFLSVAKDLKSLGAGGKVYWLGFLAGYRPPLHPLLSFHNFSLVAKIYESKIYIFS